MNKALIKNLSTQLIKTAVVVAAMVVVVKVVEKAVVSPNS